MSSPGFGSYLLLFLGMTLAVMLPSYAFANLSPGAKYCDSFDSQQTIDSEKLDLSRQLPQRYRKFGIPLFHERLLRVTVPANSAVVSKDSPQSQHVLDIWGKVLDAHHHGCAVGVHAVQFVTRAGKILLETGVSV
jgi:hypothetical protein